MNTPRLILVAMLGTFAFAVPTTRAALQQAPPISGVTGAIALEGTMKKVYAAARTVIVTTVDGVEHVVHFTTNLIVHGGKGAGVDALQGLREGATVVVHYTMQGGEEAAQEIDRIGDEGLKQTEGVVTRVDRRRRQITIRFEYGRTETFRLTERAAAEAGPDVESAPGGAKVIVDHSDEGGQKVAHYFKKIS